MASETVPWYLKQSAQELVSKFRFIQHQEDLRLRDATLNPAKSRWSLGSSVDESNDDRNRYVNIMPYERNRVKLRTRAGNDYINASYVKVQVPGQSVRPGHYIATQGPTQNSWPQFWQMCYQQCTGSDIVIAMVTPLVEGGRQKCFEYWPHDAAAPLKIPRTQSSSCSASGPESSCTTFDVDLEVHFQRSERENDYTLSTLELTPADPAFPKKTVHHFYFDRWRDMSKPDEIVPILKLSRHAHSLNSSENPMVVHCSAGVGRTGTFITLDHLFHDTLDFTAAQPVQDYSHDLVEQIVLQLRTQRLKMVQMVDQFLFIYHAARYVFDLARTRDQ
ncbi:Ptp1p [Lachancea thermotolerans]